jgi:iron(III) transport system ATP-binding protein
MAGIVLEGVTKSFGRSTEMAAVNDISLDIADNQFVTLLGPSGCGKTTTLRLIAGYLKPDAGTIHIDGKPMSSPQAVVPPEQRGMGMVFQNYAVWPHKTVFENVVFGLRVRKVPKAEARRKVEAMLALVNLAGFEDRLPSQLSGGQQQRVALARSLVVEPRILLLDEPLSNLDAKLRERMRSELKQLQRRTGITFIYVTHDQAEALALSDRIAVMDRGRLQQVATPHEVYARPANRVVADFMGNINVLPARAVDGGLVLEEGVRIALALPAGIAAGDAVDLVVRPENIVLNGPQSGLSGIVTDRTYLGNLCEYDIRLQSGRSLRAQTHPETVYDQGAAVGVAFETSRVSVFRATTDEKQEPGGKP